MLDEKPGPINRRDEPSACRMMSVVVSCVRVFGDKRMAADWLQKLVDDGVISADQLAEAERIASSMGIKVEG